MHIAICVVGAVVALPTLCLGAPTKVMPNSLDRRFESISSGGRLEAGSVIERGPDATQEDVVEIKRASDEAEGSGPGKIIKRDSDTDEVPDEPGVFI